MLHTKFQGRRSIGSGEDFLRFLNGHGGHLGHVIQLICINVYSHLPITFHMNLIPNDSTVSEKNKFEF